VPGTKCYLCARSHTISYRSFSDIAQAISSARGDAYIRNAAGVMAKINQELQAPINEVFFAPIIVLVEGIEDVAYITSYLHLMGKFEEFRRYGCHIVATNGKEHMEMPFAVARQLGIPTFLVFDSDSDAKSGWIERHRKLNATLLNLAGISPEPFPAQTLWQNDLVQWPTQLSAVVEKEFDEMVLNQAKIEAHKSFPSTGDLAKNALFIPKMLEQTWKQGEKSTSLTRLCNSILSFAESHSVPAQIVGDTL